MRSILLLLSAVCLAGGCRQADANKGRSNVASTAEPEPPVKAEASEASNATIPETVLDVPEPGQVSGFVQNSTDDDLPSDAELGVYRVVRNNMALVNACYARARRSDPSLSGKVSVQVSIGAGGRVSAVNVASSTLGSSIVESCVANVVRRMSLPASAAGQKISLPLIFR